MYYNEQIRPRTAISQLTFNSDLKSSFSNQSSILNSFSIQYPRFESNNTVPGHLSVDAGSFQTSANGAVGLNKLIVQEQQGHIFDPNVFDKYDALERINLTRSSIPGIAERLQRQYQRVLRAKEIYIRVKQYEYAHQQVSTNILITDKQKKIQRKIMNRSKQEKSYRMSLIILIASRLAVIQDCLAEHRAKCMIQRLSKEAAKNFNDARKEKENKKRRIILIKAFQVIERVLGRFVTSRKYLEAKFQRQIILQFLQKAHADLLFKIRFMQYREKLLRIKNHFVTCIVGEQARMEGLDNMWLQEEQRLLNAIEPPVINISKYPNPSKFQRHRDLATEEAIKIEIEQQTDNTLTQTINTNITLENTMNTLTMNATRTFKEEQLGADAVVGLNPIILQPVDADVRKSKVRALPKSLLFTPSTRQFQLQNINQRSSLNIQEASLPLDSSFKTEQSSYREIFQMYQNESFQQPIYIIDNETLTQYNPLIPVLRGKNTMSLVMQSAQHKYDICTQKMAELNISIEDVVKGNNILNKATTSPKTSRMNQATSGPIVMKINDLVRAVQNYIRTIANGQKSKEDDHFLDLLKDESKRSQFEGQKDKSTNQEAKILVPYNIRRKIYIEIQIYFRFLYLYCIWHQEQQKKLVRQLSDSITSINNSTQRRRRKSSIVTLPQNLAIKKDNGNLIALAGELAALEANQKKWDQVKKQHILPFFRLSRLCINAMVLRGMKEAIKFFRKNRIQF
ncbi:MAG: hypothetical protein EZS28_016644 [Streblomastix strix]|uniref:Uncharacterized protein n=1 Tax=Streblomastix strix TaxID=222440 RepID=A0A5J4VZK4_9EUKA|nr:MAG: hypothetical protein EZS28_016644 [Streblomastix strix]